MHSKKQNRFTLRRRAPFMTAATTVATAASSSLARALLSRPRRPLFGPGKLNFVRTQGVSCFNPDYVRLGSQMSEVRARSDVIFHVRAVSKFKFSADFKIRELSTVPATLVRVLGVGRSLVQE